MTDPHLICVVEDDPDIRETLQALLELEGYRVVTAANGLEALRLLDRIKGSGLPALVLLDLMMPVMNGSDFVAAARRLYSTTELPIIVLSAIAEQAKVFATQLAGILRKPVHVDYLLETVRRFSTPKEQSA